MDLSLIIPAFIAGAITFLAPCTLPLVPGYLGFISARFLAPYRLWLGRIGGIFVIIFGLFMLNVLKIPLLMRGKQFKAPALFKQGKPTNSFILGSASALLLASTSTTALQGALMLTVFSAGLAVPFLLIAVGIGSASRHIQNISGYLNVVSIIGGVFLILLGILLVTGNIGLLISYGYRLFRFINYDSLLDYL